MLIDFDEKEIKLLIRALISMFYDEYVRENTEQYNIKKKLEYFLQEFTEIEK